MSCHNSDQLNPALQQQQFYASTCSSGYQRPFKEDEDSCTLICLGLRLQACNESQLIEQLLIDVV
jgi:hypothetical protein